jgi:hypothetical protein
LGLDPHAEGMGIKGWPGVFQIRKDWTVRYTPPTIRPGLLSGLLAEDFSKDHKNTPLCSHLTNFPTAKIKLHHYLHFLNGYAD